MSPRQPITFHGFMSYLIDTFTPIAGPFVEHVELTVIALVIALAIAVPLSVLLARVRWLRGPVLGVLGVIYTIPSLSLLVLLIPLFGLGGTPAIIALVAYAQLVLVRNTVVGLTGVDPAIVEAARGMGMSGWQRFRQVELPLALPLILAGVRLATLSIIAIGTVAALVGAGGLGTPLLIGVTTGDTRKIIAGSIAVAVLAFGANTILRILERRAALKIYGEEQQPAHN
jgi:osmoprotectant transport system permease protein